jgi:hypothetical protein
MACHQDRTEKPVKQRDGMIVAPMPSRLAPALTSTGGESKDKPALRKQLKETYESNNITRS